MTNRPVQWRQCGLSLLLLQQTVCLYLEKSAVKLSLQSFRDSYYYTNDEVNRIPELKAYLQGDRPDQSLLAVKVGPIEKAYYRYV